MQSLNFYSRRSDVFKFIESIEDLDISNECNGQIITDLFGGKYDKKGFFGRVIVKDSKAYKLNMVKDTLHNTIIDESVQMDKILLQSIFAGILDSILGDTTNPGSPHGYMSRYPKTYDIIKCDNGIVAVYEECNLGTIKDFISDNIHDLDFLDRELVRCIKQMSEIVGFLYRNYDFHHSDLTAVNVMAHQTSEGSGIEYKMIDFDSVSIELENFNLSKIPHSRVPEDNPEFKKTFHGSTFYSITPLGLEPFREGFLFKTTQIRTINIDIYTLILTIIFNKEIAASLEDLPILSDLCSKIFSETDLDKMSKFLETRKQPKSDLFAVLGYIISRRLRLREDIYDVIREFDSSDI